MVGLNAHNEGCVPDSSCCICDSVCLSLARPSHTCVHSPYRIAVAGQSSLTLWFVCLLFSRPPSPRSVSQSSSGSAGNAQDSGPDAGDVGEPAFFDDSTSPENMEGTAASDKEKEAKPREMTRRWLKGFKAEDILRDKTLLRQQLEVGIHLSIL